VVKLGIFATFVLVTFSQSWT